MSGFLSGRSEFVVDDQYWKNMASSIKKRCKNIEVTYTNYLNILEKIKTDAVMEGQTHDAIVEFISIGNQLKEQFENVGQYVETTINAYLNDIDKADKYLY